jgi:V4R domain
MTKRTPVTKTPERMYPNRFARLLLRAMRDELGEFSTQSLLENIKLKPDLPPDDLERGYPFTRLSAINQALDEMYGAQGGRGLAVQIGQAWFAPGMETIAAFAAFQAPTFHALPLPTRANLGLNVLSEVFTKLGDQTSHVETTDASFHFIVEHSPFVFDGASTPVCHMLVGLVQACLSSATGGREFAVRETECRATGAKRCLFVINKKPIR